MLGKEEDAADALATILLLDDKSDEIETFNTLIDTVDGWYFNAVRTTGSGVDELSYYAEHSLDIQRAYAMVCLMVGADPKEFGETADIYEMEAERQEACAGTFAQARDSWSALLQPHIAEAPVNNITVRYEESGAFSRFAEELQSRRILDKAAELIGGKYRLPQPITMRATLCGVENAFYSPSSNEIIYCYELASAMHDLYVENLNAEDEEEVDAADGDEDATALNEGEEAADEGDEVTVRRRGE